MTCPRIDWIGYIEEAIGALQKARTEQHLLECKKCEKELARVRQSLSILEVSGKAVRFSCPSSEQLAMIADPGFENGLTVERKAAMEGEAERTESTHATSYREPTTDARKASEYFAKGAAIKKHVESCPHCRSEIALFREDPEPEVGESADLPTDLRLKLASLRRNSIKTHVLELLRKSGLAGAKSKLDRIAERFTEGFLAPQGVYALPESSIGAPPRPRSEVLPALARIGCQVEDVEIVLETREGEVVLTASRAGRPLKGTSIIVESESGHRAEAKTNERGKTTIPGLLRGQHSIRIRMKADR